jgi:disulfide bond formation protein DsbB
MFKLSIAFVERVCNAAELLGIIFVLLMASASQYFFNELPCPLCLLQRVGFLSIAFGFLLNLRFGLRPSHYAVVMLSALFTSIVSLRQIALHVVPGTGEYGSPFLGYHLYTWCYIISMIVMVVTTFMFSVDRQYSHLRFSQRRTFWAANVLFALTILIAALNVHTVYRLCGFGECPDNPTQYVY